MKRPSKLHPLSRDPRVVFLLTFFTAAFYSFYWFYKMFKMVGDKRPIVKTVFAIIFAFELFPKIYKDAGKQDHPVAMLYAAILLAASVSSSIVSFTVKDELWTALNLVIITLVVSLILSLVQKTALVSAGTLKKSKFSKPELAWIIAGALCFMLIAVDVIFFAPQHVIDARYAEIDKRYYTAEKVQAELYNKNEECVGERNRELRVLDQSDQNAVDTYNKAVDSCDRIREEYQRALDEYARIGSEYFPAILRNY